MMRHTNALPGAAALPLLTAMTLVATLSGCGASNVGSELSARPTSTPIKLGDAKAIRLPADAPFSIALAPANHAPGLDGKARAEAVADKKGAASAVAEVENGGAAEATFQLGHSFTNEGDTQLDLHCRVRCTAEHDAGATPDAGPDAAIGLKLYVRDNRNRLLRSFSLVQQTTEQGAASTSEQKDLRFVLTLAPGESVQVFLAGNAKMECKPGRSAHGSLKLRDIVMEFEPKAAPAVRTAEHVPG